MLHTYTEPPPPPPRANAAPRSPNSNFPPPPKPPPFTAKTTKGPTPTTGSQKLARFHMPDARSSAYKRKEFDDAKTKTSDFKAWEHMRHGSGPLPRSCKDNTQSAKATSGTAEGGRAFNADRDAKDPNPRRPTSRQTDWEDNPDAGMSNPQRTSTMRPVPKVNGYAPTTPNAGDEPQARSAYFNVSRADRPTSSGNRSNMPPPPPRAPTAKKADPLQAFKEQMGNAGTFGGTKRHTPYTTVHGEKTDLKIPELHRSSTANTPRESNSRTGFYNSEPLSSKNHHARAAFATTPRAYGAARQAGFDSLSTTSSDFSSDDDDDEEVKAAYLRPKQTPKPSRPRMRAGAQQRSYFNTYVRVEDAQDEPMAPGSGPRRPSGIEIPPSSNTNQSHPEGSREHREKHQSEQTHQPSTIAPTASAYPREGAAQQPPMSRPRSFEDQPRFRPQSSATQSRATPMYAKYSPISSPPSS